MKLIRKQKLFMDTAGHLRLGVTRIDAMRIFSRFVSPISLPWLALFWIFIGRVILGLPEFEPSFGL